MFATKNAQQFWIPISRELSKLMRPADELDAVISAMKNWFTYIIKFK